MLWASRAIINNSTQVLSQKKGKVILKNQPMSKNPRAKEKTDRKFMFYPHMCLHNAFLVVITESKTAIEMK